jgi:transcriptional regulator with XRE-family HTH domain
MKINEIIKKKRQEQNLTQENVAKYLGVSTPAVNKWEKGVSYPDITLLPALARLLKTDLNTLLSFKEDLTDNEIGNFSNDLATAIQKKRV